MLQCQSPYFLVSAASCNCFFVVQCYQFDPTSRLRRAQPVPVDQVEDGAHICQVCDHDSRWVVGYHQQDAFIETNEALEISH